MGWVHVLMISTIGVTATASQSSGDDPSPEPDTFVKAFETRMTLFRNSYGEFFRQFSQSPDIEDHFKPDQQYTAFVPVDQAFYEYSPIDWGFYPYNVPNFRVHNILNHFVEGLIDPSAITEDGLNVKTLGGEDMKLQLVKYGDESPPAIVVNGGVKLAGLEPINIKNGNIYSVEKILFINHEMVEDLRLKNLDKETAPLLGYPFFDFQFLSHVVNNLEENNQSAKMAHYIENTPSLRSLVQSGEFHDVPRQTYTIFVPTDAAVEGILKGGWDPIDGSENDTLNFILSHIAPGYLYSQNFTDGFRVTTANKKTLLFSKQEGKTFVNDVPIINNTYIYNLGNMFIIDGVLFHTPDDIERIRALRVKEVAEEERLLEEFFPGNKKNSENRTTQNTRKQTSSAKPFGEPAGNEGQSKIIQGLVKYMSGKFPNNPAVEELARADLPPVFKDDQEYTIFLPELTALIASIEQGADVAQLLLDSIVPGAIDFQRINNGDTLITLGGKHFVKLERKGILLLDDKKVKGQVKDFPTTFGRMYLISHFLEEPKVYNKSRREIEYDPPLIVQEVLKYLKNHNYPSYGLRSVIQQTDFGTLINGSAAVTVFLPSAYTVRNSVPQDTVDVLSDDLLRRRLVLNLFLSDKLDTDNLENDLVVKTILGTPLSIKKVEGVVYVNDSRVLKRIPEIKEEFGLAYEVESPYSFDRDLISGILSTAPPSVLAIPHNPVIPETHPFFSEAADYLEKEDRGYDLGYLRYRFGLDLGNSFT